MVRVIVISLVLLSAPTTGRTVAMADEQRAVQLLTKAGEDTKAGRIHDAIAARVQAVAMLATDEEQITQWLEISRLYGTIGRSYQQADALAEALSLLEPYDARYPSVSDQLLTLYRTMLSTPGAAVAFLEKQVQGLEPGRGNLHTWYELGMTLLNTGDLQRGREILRAVWMTAGLDDATTRELVFKKLGFCVEYSPGEATFNRNLETSALLGQFQTRINEKKWPEAIDVTVELLKRYPDAVMDATGTAGCGPYKTVAAFLQTMPGQAQQTYQQTCTLELQHLLRDKHTEVLEQFVRTHPWPALRSQMMAAVGDALMAEERFARASAFYRAAIDAAADDQSRVNVKVKASRAAILGGLPISSDLPMDSKITMKGESLTLGQAIEQWKLEAKDTRSEPISIRPLSEMKHDQLRLQQSPLAMRKWQVGWQPDHRHRNPVMHDAFMPFVMAGDRETMFLNTSEMIYAFDPVEERLLWTRSPSDVFVAELSPPSLKQMKPMQSPKQFRIAVSGGAVFWRFNWADRADEASRSALFAAQRKDGVLLWSTERVEELKGMRFATDPTYADGMVIAALWEPREIPVFYLAAFDAISGELLWKTHMFSGTMFPAIRESGLTDQPLDAPPPVVSGDAVYYAPGVGVVACVDLLQGHVRWFQRYPRYHEYGPDNWGGEFIFNRPSSPILVRDNITIVAPRDAHGLLMFDTKTGELLRSYESIDFRSLFGASQTHAYIQQGRSLASVRIDNAEIEWEIELPTSAVVGIPALSERGIVCGTRENIIVVSSEDGTILEQKPSISHMTVGNPLDLGDRILAVSHDSIFVLGSNLNGDASWHTPRSPTPGALEVDTLAPTGIVRWALPSPDRNDFFFSPYAPDLVVIRTLETIELRQLDPAPTLLWECAVPSWPRSIQFDRKSVLIEYPDGRLIAVDVAAGRERWHVLDRSMAGERAYGWAVPWNDYVIWFDLKRLQVLDITSGKKLWDIHLADEEIIRGLTFVDAGLGLFLERSGNVPMALLFDPSSGEKRAEIALADEQVRSKDSRFSSVRGVVDDIVRAPVGPPMAQVGVKHIVVVDFENGTRQIHPAEGRGELAGPLLLDNVLCIRDDNYAVIAALDTETFKPLAPRRTGLCCIADGVQYLAQGPRIIAVRLTDGDVLWQSRAWTWQTTHMTVAGDLLLLSQNRVDPENPLSRVTAIRRSDGELVTEVEGLAFAFHKIGWFDRSLYVSDSGYFYRFSEPSTQDTLRISQSSSDVDAIAAIELARHQAKVFTDSVASSAVTPVIDGEMSDWDEASWHRLGWPRHWRPDHSLLSDRRLRRPTDAGDLSAELAIAQDDSNIYIAVRVQDDCHTCEASCPLVYGDSVTVRWQGAGQPPFVITGGMVDHVPLIELGTAQSPRLAMPDTAYWPVWVQTLRDVGDIGWLRRWQNQSVRLNDVIFVGRRDDASGTTVYEIVVPVRLLPGDRKEADSLLWDVMVNESDGQGRDGALALGSSIQQLHRAVGLSRWPTYKPDAP